MIKPTLWVLSLLFVCFTMITGCANKTPDELEEDFQYRCNHYSADDLTVRELYKCNKYFDAQENAHAQKK